MSLPTCEVVCVVRDQSGNPEVGAIVEATLSDFDVSLGYVVPERVHAETGVDGVCKLNLWPNELGSTGSFYNVRIRTKSGRSERLRVTVPNQVQALLQDIAELPAFSGKPDSYLATEQAVYAASQALSHSLTAQNAASSSSSSAAQAAASESAANVSAVAAAASQVASAASESAASASASQASASASAAGASQSASASSASAAAGSELAAASSATAAATSATAAQGSQTAAATSASSAATSATNAAASETNAAASASAASTSQTAAADAAATATTKATEAAASADAAATFDPAQFVPRSGNVTMTGPLSVPAGASGAQVPQAQEVLHHTFPSGTKMLFAQTTAPTGWTKDTTHDNKALRVVTGSASSGGTVAFTDAFKSHAVAGTVGMTTLTVAQMPNHNHQLGHGTQNGPGGSGWNWKSQNAGAVDWTYGTGGNEGHNHAFTGTAINLAVQYVDVIIATKN